MIIIHVLLMMLSELPVSSRGGQLWGRGSGRRTAPVQVGDGCGGGGAAAFVAWDMKPGSKAEGK